MTLDEIGKKFGLIKQGVRHRFVVAGIERRSKVTGEEIDKKRLETLYFKDRLPIPEIARVFSVNIIVIRKALKFHEIPKRESLKKGGYIVNVLRNLEVNDKAVIECRREKYVNIHPSAIQIGMKISIKSLGSRRFEITRIG